MDKLDKVIHPFEEAGLGLAPFKCVGHERRVGPLDMGNGCFAGAPGQPMGTCNYCGQGIADCYRIRSADGKSFIVGSDCVRRTYATVESGLPLDIRREIAAVEREKREVKRVAEMERLIARVRAASKTLEDHHWLFCGEPHPNSFYASQGKSLRDYYFWTLQYGSQAGRREVCKLIETADARAAG